MNLTFMGASKAQESDPASPLESSRCFIWSTANAEAFAGDLERPPLVWQLRGFAFFGRKGNNSVNLARAALRAA